MSMVSRIVLVRTALLIALGLGLVLATRPDPVNAAFALLASGRAEAALSEFTHMRADGRADAQVLFGQALAALRANDLSEAEAAAKELARRDDPLAREGWLLAGEVAFEQGLLGELATEDPSAGPLVFEVPIAWFRAAMESWIAAMDRGDERPATRRNLERAAQHIEALRRRAESAQIQSRRERIPEPRVRPTPTSGQGSDREADRPNPAARADGRGATQSREVVPVLAELDALQVAQLLERLGKRDEERRAVRRRDRERSNSSGASDW